MRCPPAVGVVCSALGLLCAAPGHGPAAGIEGRVSLPKAEAPVASPRHYPGQASEVVPPDRPAAVVYLEGHFPPGAAPAASTTNEVLQSGTQFHPALLPVRVGTAVAFPNGDNFYHNVFSYSKTKRFDLGRYRKEERPPPVVVFDKPGPVKLYCEIHQHMRGVILVLDTPYFTRTQANGRYRLEDLPAGNYVLKAWVDENHVYEKAVSLQAGQHLHVDFGLR